MASEKIIVSATDSGGNSVQRTFDNVNPDATNAQLAAFGSKIAGFSENTYAKTDRINRVNCDTTPDPPVKQTPTITLNETTITCADLVAALTADTSSHRKSFTFTHTSDAVPYAYITNNAAFFGVSVFSNGGTNTVFITTGTNLNNITGFSYSGEVVVCLPETDNFKAAQAVFTITA